MCDNKFPNAEQYKELNQLMTYILDEMWGVDNKELIREGIIAYANKWHEVQSSPKLLSKKIPESNESHLKMIYLCQKNTDPDVLKAFSDKTSAINFCQDNTNFTWVAILIDNDKAIEEIDRLEQYINAMKDNNTNLKEDLDNLLIHIKKLRNL